MAKQELISLKFSLKPDENEKRVKAIYMNWKELGIHKEQVFDAILNYAGVEPKNDKAMVKILTALTDDLQAQVNRLETMKFTAAPTTQDKQESTEFNSQFHDTMIGAWE